ncbi:MAG: AmmeMemoRadiSam system protein B [Desulfomonilaceae bacterium]|nr:AmmeMemoRadiSam system protein B [Desulfomonilaceae bacterium]
MHADRNDKPKLRHVEPVQIVHEGRQLVGLKDPLKLTDRMLCFSMDALPLLAMLDGTHSLLDIQASLSARSGRLVFFDDVKEIVERLDDAALLEGDRFKAAFARLVEDYRKQPCRPCSHAGMSYSVDPDELRGELRSFFDADGGPGLPDFFTDERRPIGLIAPHIDIRAGGPCFARGYHALASGQPSDVYVILGTGHAGVEGMFTACSLDFQTPLGIVRTDRELLGRLGEALGRDPAEEEILHAHEHVIEFQLVFLQYLLSDRHEFTILPVLCSLSHHIFDDRQENEVLRDRFHEFCRALKAVCAESSKRVCFVASADLDHIGPRYGDSFTPHKGTVDEALEKDNQILRHLERVDVRSFIRDVALDNDARRICGFSPITTMLHCIDATTGNLLSLDHAQVDNRNSFVSFTSMIFH